MLESTLLLLSKLPSQPLAAAVGESDTKCNDSRVHVLVVDDEHLITDTICAILRRNGFDATGVYSGSDALTAARKIRPDIVLSDVLMPKMSGVELGIQLRSEFPGVKFFLFSGQAATTAMIHRAEAEGHFFELFPKPIHPEELVNRLRGF